MAKIPNWKKALAEIEPPASMPFLGTVTPKKWHKFELDISKGVEETLTGPEEINEKGDAVRPWPAYIVWLDDEEQEIPFWARKSFYEEIIKPIAEDELEVGNDGKLMIEYRRLVDGEDKNEGEFRGE